MMYLELVLLKWSKGLSNVIQGRMKKGMKLMQQYPEMQNP